MHSSDKVGLLPFAPEFEREAIIFRALLEKYEIAFLCDVRSAARSRWVQFNGAVLQENLRENGIGYEHLPECGGKIVAKPEDLASGVERIL